jgi:hypothetical protein
MQHEGCEEIQLLISRFVDDEVSTSERKRVEEHVAVCDECAYKLLEYMEMALLFSETPLKLPDPELRSSLYREIGNIKDEARRKEEADILSKLSKGRPWFLPTRAERDSKRGASSPVLRGLMQAVSPLAMAAAALFVFLGALLLGNWRSPNTPPPTLTEIQAPPYIPTLEAPINTANVDDVPPPVMTKVGLANASPAASSSSYVNATATLGRDMLIELTQPTPVWEEGDPSTRASWHTARDPEYGYTICYPPNWWTRMVDGVRYLYPWTAGGTRFAPYWVEMHIYPNDKQLSPDTANQEICGGKCAPVTTADGREVVGLRRTSTDTNAGNFYDDAYIFDNERIYQLRVSVPTNSVTGATDFTERVKSGESVWAMMTGRLVLAGDQRAGYSTFGGVLFLNGTDLWLANAEGKQGAFKVTRGFLVKQYAQSPDLNRIAFAAADPKDASSPWARAIYLTRISSDGPVTPLSLLSDMEVHDIAWYSDHDLLALARSDNDGLALYKISLVSTTSPASGKTPQVEQIVKLPEALSGAMSLGVSPDRQMITFLAPVGEKKGTDIYAVRPDGTDLRMVVSHSEPVSPLVGDNLVLAPESQAIKSYIWADGHLEPDGYAANLLFTSGNSSGPFSYPGGYLYSSSSASSNPLVDPASLTTYAPERMQIIPIAYSAQGKVAMAGYRSDVSERADLIVGLWTGDLVHGKLVNVQSQPTPEKPHGVVDLQWSPDGKSLIYRETIPSSSDIRSWRYDGISDFRLMKLDIETGNTTLLFDGERR